jgi:hypothetical protein
MNSCWRSKVYATSRKTRWLIEDKSNKDGKSYQVLYYHTDLKQRDDKITDDELTPLVFENGKLIGWGYPFLDQKVPPKPVYTR